MADERIIQQDPGTVNVALDEAAVDNSTDGTRRVPVGRANGLAALDASGMPLTSGGAPIVESGSNSNGNWVRYADGTQICNGIVEKTNLNIGIATGNWYRCSGGAVKWTYPQEFISTPIVNANIIEVSGNDITMGPFSNNLLTKTEANPLILKSVSGSVDLMVMFTAIGRWK